MSKEVPEWFVIATELEKLKKLQAPIEWEPEPLYLEIDIPRNQQQEQPLTTDDVLSEDVIIIQL